MTTTMNIPLIVNSFVDASNKQKLEVWTNSKRMIVDPPFKPYLLSKVPLPITAGKADIEEIKAYPLSTLKETLFHKYSFANTYEISNINKSVEAGENEKKMILADNHTEFRERIIIDNPYYFSQYANTDPLKILCFDIETVTLDGTGYGYISSIAWGTNTKNIKSKHAQVYWKRKPETADVWDTAEVKEFTTVDAFVAHILQHPNNNNRDETLLFQSNDPEDRAEWLRRKIHAFTRGKIPYVRPEDEAEMLYAFIDAIIELDPDIITGYFLEDFDFPQVFERCTVHKINYAAIARENSGVDVKVKKVGYEERKKIIIGGRVVYDILNSVRADQSLHGIKRRKLKNVAEWMNLEVLREDTENTSELTVEKLRKYNEHDVYTTLQLYDIYSLNNITLSEMFGIPLNMIFDGSPSFLANVFHGIDLHAMGIVTDGMNRVRHTQIYNRADRDKMRGEDYIPADDEDDENDAVYEAAYVDIYKKGIFPKVRKVDYKGMYNAIEITGNISPETTKIVNFIPYDENGFKYEKRGNFTIYYVPDKRIGMTVMIAVNNSFDGVLRKKLREVREKRFAIKQQMKIAKEEGRLGDLPKLESQQYGLKVIANIPSGYNGQAFARWGDIAVSILTVGIGRLLIRDTIKYVENKYGGNVITETNLKNVDRSKFKICIEVDTDGIYVCEDIDVKDLNSYLENRVRELLGVEESEMQLDFEEYGAGCFVKMKNYILYDEHDNLVIHGASLKGSRQPKCYDTALELLARCLLKGEGKTKDVIKKVLAVEKYDIRDLSLGVRLGKDPDTYDAGSMIAQLISAARAQKLDVKAGTEFDYVKTYDGYALAQSIKSIYEVDLPYYQKMLSKLIINLGLEEDLRSKDTASIDSWL